MTTVKKLSKYIVSFDTLVLEPILNERGTSTRVIERNEEIIVPQPPLHVVKKSCTYYGGSLKASVNTARLKLRNHHKTPIIIAHNYGRPYIFLPTLSPKADQNVWICYHGIHYFEAFSNLESLIYLDNGQSIIVDISISTLYRQYTFASFLEKDFFHRQKQLTRTSSEIQFQEELLYQDLIEPRQLSVREK